MSTNTLAQVEACANEVADAAKDFAEQCRLGYSTSSAEVVHARRNLLALVARFQVMLFQPADFLQHLVTQTQILACLQWLGDFQILACIPLGSSVRVQDVAEIASVPESQLYRVVRMMAMVGFLIENQPGHIGHTELSASFVTKPSHLDAAMFLADTAAPTALHMASATKRYGQPENPTESSYSVAFNTPQPFLLACEQRPKLRRQWPAYLRYISDEVDDEASAELLGRLDWFNLGNALIVDVGARSASYVSILAQRYPLLRFVVQVSEAESLSSNQPINNQLNERISVQKRVNGLPQTLKDAAVYMVRLTLPALTTSSAQLRAQILAELRAHLGVLSANLASTLILEIRVLPESKTVDPCVEAKARVLDLSLLQFGSDTSLEMSELTDLVYSVQNNGSGRLVVFKKLSSCNSPLVVLGVKYKASPDRQR
ncbi:nonfunctional aflatoxin co-regulatory protein [Stipitochalara longipes BDJ]|nr:nonfunctional aflatoxin co-regulatory protein [Stipitochalara longipes BDJ]